jgi:acetyl esterase/lipase
MKDVPVLIFAHGGGWRMGNKDMYAYIGETFARNGLGTAVINYRLSPGAVHPAHVKDVARAFAWVSSHIESYGGRKDQIFLAGHSAGGHLCALLALDETYREDNSSVKGVICISSIYDISAMAETPWGKSMVIPAFGVDPQVWREASPVHYIHEKIPPFLIFTAERDFSLLKRQTRKVITVMGDAEFFEIPIKDHFTIINSIGTKKDALTANILQFVNKNKEG